MKKKVLLLRPKNLLHLYNYPPLGLICIGSALENNGYEVKIVPCGKINSYENIIEKEIEDTLFVGITALTSEAPHAIELTEYIKKISPKTPVVWGGWHSTLFSKQIAKSELVDYVVIGDGENAIVEIANKLSNGKKLEEKILSRPVDIEKLPMPNYDMVINLEDYINDDLTDRFTEFLDKNVKMRWLPYQSSRGCPHRCKFCINFVTNNQFYRKKSPDKVVNEIEFLQGKYDLAHFKILDDNFFSDIKRVKGICEKIIEKDLEFTWDAECRVDYFKKGFIDDSLLHLLKQAGLVQLTLGLESGSQDSLDRIAKDTTVSQNEYALKQLEKYGILQRVSFIIDVPGDENKDIMLTQKFVNKIRKYKKIEIGMAAYRPYPKSPFTEILMKEGLINEPKTLDEWKDYHNVALYGMYDTKKPWQKNFKLSTNMAFYNSVESGVWLREKQAKNFTDIILIKLFKNMAKLRNRLLFYDFAIDRKLYTLFRDEHYKGGYKNHRKKI